MSIQIPVDYFNEFIELIPQPVCLLKACNKVLYAWNSHFKNITGYPETEIKGKAWSLFFTFDSYQWKPLLMEIKKNGFISDVSGQVTNCKGKKIPVLGSIKLVNIAHEDFFLVSLSEITSIITRDQRTRKKLIKDQRLRFHFENTPLAIVEWDTNFIVTRWSRKAEKMFGWKASETIGKPINDLNIIYPEDIPVVDQTMEKLMKERTVVSGNRNVTKDGRVIYCIWYNSVLKDENGQMISVMSLVDDITKQKKDEEQLLEYSEHLEKLVEARTSELKITNSVLQEEIAIRTQAEKTLREQARELNELKDNLEELVHERTAELQANNKKLTREIIERRRAVEALKESERKYREIVQNIPGMVFQLKVQRDGSNKFSYISPHAGDLFNLPFENISDDWEFTNYIHPDDRAAFISSIGNAIESHNEWEFEGRILTPDNEIKWFQGISSPSLVGQELVLDGLMLDITDKKLIKEALEQSEQHFRSLFTSIDEGFHMSRMIFDKEGNPVDFEFIIANDSFYSQTGLKKDIQGKKATDVFDVLEPVWLQTYARVVRTGIAEHFEEYNEGTGRSYSVYVYHTSGNNFAVIFHDLTEKKAFFDKILQAQETAMESQMHYRKLFDSMSDGVQVIEMIFDEKDEKAVDWKYIAVNPAWHEQTGILMDVVGKTVKEFIPEIEQSWLDTYGRVVKTGIPESFENYNNYTERFYFTYTYKLKDHQCAVVVRDITRKIDIQKQLELSEKRFRMLFEAMTEGFQMAELIYDKKGECTDIRYLAVNQAWYKQTGIKEDVVGKMATKIIPGLEKVWIDNNAKVASTGIPLIYEDYNEFTCRYYHVNTFKIDNNICATIFTDITKQKNEANELNVNLTKYRVLFELSPMGITVCDKEGRIIEINEKAKEILEVREDEMKKRTIGDTKWNIIRPDGTILPASDFPSVRALKEDQIISNQEMGIVKDDREVTWLNVTAAPIPLDGYGVAITYNDITEKFRSNEIIDENLRSYRTLFNAMNEGFAVHEMIFDDEGKPVDYRFIEVNPAFEKMTGLHRDNVIGKKVTEVLPNIEKEWIESYGEVVETGKPAYIEKYSHTMKKYFRVFAYSPAPGQFAAMFIDISDSRLQSHAKSRERSR